MTVTINNPVHIDRIKLTETLSGKPVVNLYHGALKHPVLQLFQFHHLLTVGIDPNELIKGETIVTSFNAHWMESEKTTKKGNAYKDVLHLEPLMTATANAPLSVSLEKDLAETKKELSKLSSRLKRTNEQLNEVKEDYELLRAVVKELSEMVRYLMNLPAEEAIGDEPPPTAAAAQDDSLADEFFSLKFANGGDVPEQHHEAFQTWQRENGRAPTPTEFYMSINQEKSRIKSRPAR